MVQSRVRVRWLLPLALFASFAAVVLSSEKADTKSAKDDDDSPIESRFKAVAKELDQIHESFTTLTAHFFQLKTVSLLAQPVRNEGWFYFRKPDNLCWEMQPPEPMIMLITSDKLTIYYPDLKQAELIDVASFRGRLQQAMAFGQSSSVLRKYYLVQVLSEFTYDPAAEGLPQFLTREAADLGKTKLAKPVDLALLEMLPKNRRLQKKIDKVRIWLDKSTWLPMFISYDQENGDRATMFFDQIYRDRPIPEEIFNRTLPADVTIKKRHTGGRED